MRSEHDSEMPAITVGSLDFKIEDPDKAALFSFVDFGYRISLDLFDQEKLVKPVFKAWIRSTELEFDSLPEFRIFPKDSTLIEIRLDPEEPQTIHEGEEKQFKAEIIAVAGLGSGVFSAEKNSLVVLDFYRPKGIDFFDWQEIPITDEKLARTLKEISFEHIFNPWYGPGLYELSATALVNFETGYDSTFYLQAAQKSEVEVLPGFVILSPLDDLAYPLGAGLKVITNVDEDLKKWEKIKWQLNGHDYKPNTDEPPFFISLDHSGKWSLVATLTIDPEEENRKTVELGSQVHFSVQPVNYELNPKRKVYPKDKASNIAVELDVEINGKKVEKPGDKVPWQEDYLFATVDKVEWAFQKKADGCAEHESEEGKFQALVSFNNEGALTAQATITVHLLGAEEVFKRKFPFFKDSFEDPIFELPAVRADLWAVKPLVWFNTIGKTARRAIQNTNRLFSLVSGQIKFYGNEYSWDNHSDFADKIAIPAAIPNIKPLTSVGVKFAWSGPDEQSSKTPEFKPDFKNTGTPEVVMASSIEFDSGDSINFENDKTDVKVEPLSKVIYVKVMAYPPTVGKNQPSKVSLSFGEINGAMDSQTQLDIWDGEYNLKLTKVDWSYSGGVLTPTDDNGANAKFSSSDAGQFKISGTPNFSVKPLDCEEVDIALNPGETSVKVLGSLIGIRVDNTLPDHLKKIRYATDPENDIYKKSDNRIWSRTDTQPLVVACNSTITLIPEFEGQKKPKTKDGVTFQWFNSLGLLSLSGNTDLADKIEFPTPTIIDKYSLKLGFAIVGETIEIPETYTVKKISAKSATATGTANMVYYMKCIKDSVDALKGRGIETEDARLVNDFYDWWWSDKNKLVYGITYEGADPDKSASTYNVIKYEGGKCQALGNYFFKCLECQGVSGLKRVFFHLLTEILPKETEPKLKTDIDHFPFRHEYWGALFIKNDGLHNDKYAFYLPSDEPDTVTPYMREPIKEYTDQVPRIPPVDYQHKIVADLDKNITIHSKKELAWVFRAPDGHALVFHTESGGKTRLLDPSFPLKEDICMPSPPIYAKDVELKNYGNVANENAEFYEKYFDNYVYFRGNTAFKQSLTGISGMTIIDCKMSQINYLKFDLAHYNSREEITNP
ncbi:MAG: hypothetical protein AB1403_05700 [Candidatus Riflebacteria bacterium]